LTGDNRALTGQWLGNYRLLGLLKKGGMAEVYRAQEIETGREVAVKVLSPALAADPEYVTSFRNEIAQVRKLDHPNIVPIEAFGEQGSYLYLVMPLLRASLHDVLMLHERLEPLEAIRVAEQIAWALTSVHALGLIHRDIKPGNILLSVDRALLTDFGIVRQIAGGDAERPPTLAGTGLVIGTPQYMAPEQLTGQPVDFRADLYALGAVLYQMLTGQPPHTDDTPYAVAARALNEPIVPPSVRNPAISPELDAVVLRALARDPNDRYANADSMRQALRQVEPQFQFARSGATPSGVHRNTGHGGAIDGSGGNDGGALPPRGGPDGDDRQRRGLQPALLIALAAALLGIAVFCGLGLAINSGANGVHGGSALAPLTPTLSSDPTYDAMAATATTYALTPTVTTGPGTPTPTPRPPLPTRTPTPRPPTVTVGPGTPTPTPYPTDTPVPPPTATDTPAPQPTATDTPEPTATDTPTDIPTDTPS
jgi:serine/threonine-protein kinase